MSVYNLLGVAGCGCLLYLWGAPLRQARPPSEVCYNCLGPSRGQGCYESKVSLLIKWIWGSIVWLPAVFGAGVFDHLTPLCRGRWIQKFHK